MLSRFTRIFREPLVQFVAIGFMLFVLVSIVSPTPDANNSYTIDVSEERLINFLQFRNKSFNAVAAKEQWSRLTGTERETLIADFVRDEVLYREALSLGLEQDDQIIRRRLIQKLDYVSRGFITDAANISEDQLQRYFDDNKSDYRIDASITFTHVFFDASKHANERLNTLAVTTLNDLNANDTPFDYAPRFGDRFLYHRNYVDRTPEFIASHFSEAFSENVFGLSASDGQWHGPYVSRYGSHLVRVTKNMPSRTPELAEVASIVLEDARRINLDERRKEAVDKMIAKYTLRSDVGVSATADSQAEPLKSEPLKSEPLESDPLKPEVSKLARAD